MIKDESVDQPIDEIEAEVYGAGKYRTITTVAGLADVLLYSFPTKGCGDDYHTAMLACLDCLQEGDTNAIEAREAFVAAARECGVSVLPDDGPTSTLGSRSCSEPPA